jgi:hypothetical protein
MSDLSYQLKPEHCPRRPQCLPGLPQSLKGTIPETWKCIDCGFNTAPGYSTRIEVETAFVAGVKSIEQTANSDSEIYTVRTHVWKNAGMEPDGGCLCIGCIEKRLGRRLRPNDFQRDDPLNLLPATPRLRKRRGA